MKRLSDDSGFTLIELLVAVLILGLAVSAILGGYITAVVASSLHRQQASVHSLVIDFAESIQAETYKACASAANAYGAWYSLPSQFDPAQYEVPAITEYRYWDGNTPAGWVPFATCNSSGDQGLQSLELRAASRSDQQTETLVIYKRKT